MLIDRNCHKSHHYGLVLAGARPVYLDAYPLQRYAIYGGVPLRTLKQKLLDLRRAGQLDRVRLVVLTNVTFDGILYQPERVMEELLAIHPGLCFLWDEAWFAYARFLPLMRQRTGMAAAKALGERLARQRYRHEYRAFRGGWGRGGSTGCPTESSSAACCPIPNGRGAGVRHAVHPQVAVRVPPGVDDPRLGRPVRAPGGGSVHRGVPHPHQHLAQPPAGRRRWTWRASRWSSRASRW